MISLRRHRQSLSAGRTARERGVGIVAVLLVIAVLGILGGVITTLVAAGAVSKTNDMVREQSWELGTAGLEYALKRIDDGFDPDGDMRDLGAGQFTVGYAPTGVITIATDVSAMEGSSSPSFTIQGPTPGGTMADCLTVDVSGTYQHDQWWPDEIRGTVLQNTCNAQITISEMTVSWTPTSTDHVTRIRIANSNVYNNWPGTLPGVPIDITDRTINACSSQNLTYIRFDTELPDKNFTITFTMSDGSVKTRFLQFIVGNESACLTVDLSPSYIGGSGYVDMREGELTNSCAAPTVIGVEGMIVEWTPTSPSRHLTGIRMDDWMWSGWASSGTSVSFWGPVLIDAGASQRQRFLEFDTDMRGYNYPAITYIMRDSTQHTVSKNFYAANMASCLVVGTGSTYWSNGNRRLRAETFQNTCALGIVIERIQSTWSGAPGTRYLQQIRIGGSNVYSGWAGSGTNVDIDNVEVPGGSTITVDRYVFSGSMSGATVSHVMTMLDGTTVSVPSFTP